MTAFPAPRSAIPLALVLLAVLPLSAPAMASDAGPAPRANLITLDTTPAGLLVAVNGTPVQAPYSFPCEPGTNRTISAPSPQVNGSVRYTFASWSDGGGLTHEISCNAPANVTASFQTEYELRIQSDPAAGLVVEIAGTPYATPATIWCLPGSSRFVNAFQQAFGGARYTPMNWSDGGAIGHTVVCGAPRVLTLFFLTEYLVGLFAVPSGAFAFLVDGGVHRAPGSFWCSAGSFHTVEVPSPQSDNLTGKQYGFDHWLDFGPNPRSFVCNFSMNYTAVFVEVDTGGPPPPPFSGVGVLLIILTAVVLAILIPVLVLWWVDRRKPGVVSSPPPTPVGMRAASGPVPRCPRCGAAAAADWRYCMTCGADLPAP